MTLADAKSKLIDMEVACSEALPGERVPYAMAKIINLKADIRRTEAKNWSGETQ